MGRTIVLSVIFLMLIGGRGFALPDWVNIDNFYSTPSSGSLGPTTDTEIHNATGFSSMPNGGFEPPTASFQIQNGIFSVAQPRPTLQFKDRWLFDYASGWRRPHRQQHHRRRWVIGCYRCTENVRPQA